MLQKTETARRWVGERLPNDVLASSVNTSEDTLQALRAQRIFERFRTSREHAGVIADALFRKVAP